MISSAFDPDSHVGGYTRSPADILRLVVLALATLLVFAVTRWGRDAITGVEQDLLALAGFLTPTWERVLSGVLQLAVILALATIWTLPLLARRFRLASYVVLTSVLAGALATLLDAAANLDGHPLIRNELAQRAGIDSVFPHPWVVAALAGAFVVASPFVTARWRRFGAGTIVALVAVRLLVSAHLPADVFLALVVGGTCGASVLALLGRPNTRPTAAAVGASLVHSGLAVAEIRPASVDARGSTPYFATLDGGSSVFAKVMGTDERGADLLFRAYRWLRLRDVGDQLPFSTLRRGVEHEAFVSLRARDVGVRTPRLRAATEVGSDSWALAYDQIAGSSLDSVAPQRWTDGVVDDLWTQVATLRTHRIAHRDLRLANLFLDDENRIWVIDFGFSEIAADDTLLRADLAQLLVSCSLTIGVERTVDAAVVALGAEAVATSLGRLQRRTLSGATATALKDQPGLLDDLRETVADRCGVEVPPLEPVQRLSGRSVFTVVMLGAITYFLVPQLADLPGVIGQVRGADWSWALPTIIASAGTYLGAAISLAGCSPGRLPMGPTFIAQVASSYASKLAPAGLGGMALNVRFLQKIGVDGPVATSAVGLNTVGGFAGHLLLLVVFAVWAGQSAFDSVRLPDPEVLLIGAGVVVATLVIGLLIPPVRRAIVGRLLPILRKAGAGLRDVVSRPAKLALMLGGSTLITLSYIAAVWFSANAFGATLSFAQIGAIYLAGSAVATAAPTPGGLGALEAALIAGFVAAGMDRDIAIPTVFFFRLATFWLPIAPGAVSFSWLRRHEYL